jgi:arsenite-transporting ATPase
LLKEAAVDFLARPARNLFFTGKGGVGKTSLACAAAVALADRGRRVLLVSTDPASNLDEVLGVALGGVPTVVPGAEGLSALNIDPEQAAREYRERVVGPYRGVLPPEAVAAVEEQLSGACAVEVAAFDQFARFLGDPSAAAGFDHVIFDTAPTGHTLRLLSLPSAWDGFLGTSPTGATCLGPLSGLAARRELYRAAVTALTDPASTLLVLVSRPDPAALAEADRAGRELATLGIANQHLAVNGVFAAADRDDPAALALERQGWSAVRSLPAHLGRLPRSEVPAVAHALVGLPALRALVGGPAPTAEATSAVQVADLPPLSALVDELATAGHGVVLVVGKGGVGKTTVAAAVAAGLAARGLPVLLTTTDPAAHVESAVGLGVPGLRVGRIDPRVEGDRYRAAVLGQAGGLNADALALLEEDLRSPCTEEVAVFRAFADAVAGGEAGFVVADTAPTGHTLLLLDAAQAYHREAARQAGSTPEAVRRLLPRLRDPQYTRVLVVTLPEATPVHEAARLQDDLARAGVHPFAWVVNRSLTPLAVTDPTLAALRRREAGYVNEVAHGLARRAALVPLLTDPPAGAAGLLTLAGAGRAAPALFRDERGGMDSCQG